MANNPIKVSELPVYNATPGDENSMEILLRKNTGNYRISLSQIFSLATISGAIKGLIDQKVSKAGDETIDGVKNFSSSPVIPDPTTNLQAANKQYTDTADAGLQTQINGKQATLVSGVNIKTLGGVALLGAGDIPTSSGKIVGEVRIWATTSAPNGWHICDGSAVSRSTYSDLFNVLGTAYGAGDGSTTFNLPNMKGRVVVGYDASQPEFDTLGEVGGEKNHVLTIGEMPAHTHNVAGDTTSGVSTTAFKAVGVAAAPFTLPTSSEGGGAAHNNLQPYITLNYIIAY